MLIEFSVKNFASLKDKVTLTMEKGSGNENPENVIEKYDLLKNVAIYGANASGKSNLLKAFHAALTMIRNSNIMPIGGTWDFLVPFMFNDNSKNNKTEFEFIFVTNNTKYRYSFTADKYKIYDEILDAYYSQKPTNVFTRVNTNEYTFTSDKQKLESLASKNTDNKLFLTTATTWNYDKTRDAFMWFQKYIDVYDSFDKITDRDLISYSNIDSSLKDFALKLLREADILIKDIHVDYKEREVDSRTLDLLVPPLDITEERYKIKNINIELEHEVISGNKEYTYKLNLKNESSGTKILFVLAPFLKQAFTTNKVIFIDELEKSLHPNLVLFIIKLFNNKKINKANSQLIFTTHDINLLDIDILRRDQIWFTEKNADSGITSLYPLDSFSVRKDENIKKGYINGRYGAIPFIKDIDLWLEE